MLSNEQNEIVSKNSELVKRRAEFDLRLPPASEIEAHVEATRRTFEQLISSFIGSNDNGLISKGKAIKKQEYTPVGSSNEHKVKIVEKQNDPLEPPRHRYQKSVEVNVVDETNRAPVMRNPSRRLTAEEKEQWRVPRSISNWKNSKGLLLDRAKDTTSRASNSLQAVNKRLDLRAALEDAAEEVNGETARLIDKEEYTLELKRRLLNQKEKKQNETPAETSDLFDSRLFHNSRKRPQEYDSDLFVNRSEQMKAKLKKNHVEFETAK